jgi:hypothetical protein
VGGKYIYILCVNNNAIIIIYGRLKDLILLFKISKDKLNNFFEIYREFGYVPSESFASPGLCYFALPHTAVGSNIPHMESGVQ